MAKADDMASGRVKVPLSLDKTGHSDDDTA